MKLGGFLERAERERAEREKYPFFDPGCESRMLIEEFKKVHKRVCHIEEEFYIAQPVMFFRRGRNGMFFRGHREDYLIESDPFRDR